MIARFCAREISESQARLRPPHVLLRAVDLVEHHGLIEGAHQFITVTLMLPEVPLVFGASVVRRFQIAHALILDRH